MNDIRPFLKLKHKQFPDFFCKQWKMAHTVLLNCPIKAEIRAVDNQSDLRILL